MNRRGTLRATFRPLTAGLAGLLLLAGCAASTGADDLDLLPAPTVSPTGTSTTPPAPPECNPV